MSKYNFTPAKLVKLLRDNGFVFTRQSGNQIINNAQKYKNSGDARTGIGRLHDDHENGAGGDERGEVEFFARHIRAS